MKLFDDQADMIERTVQSLRKGHKSVLMQYPTGGGKSVMATEIVRRAVAKGNNVWFTVPRRELIRQMGQTFQDFDLPYGLMAAGHRYRPDRAAYVCSTDTIKSRLASFTPPALAVIDETHFGGEGLDRIIQWLKAGGTTILGLSATPWKLSGQGLGCWYDDMVIGPSVRELIDAGRLSDYRGFAPSHIDMRGIGISGGDYAKKQLADMMEANKVLIGNAVQHYKTHALGKLNVTYCVSIAHSKMVAESYNVAGVPAAHIDGKTPDDERRRIIRAYANRELLVLCNCELLTFGFDLASQVGMEVTIECMSDLRPTKSLALQMQKWGRVLRRKAEPAIIFDHANNFLEHGLPCDERDWTLSDREKGKGGKKGEAIIPVKECDRCHFCHKPAPQCPNCGNIYEVQSRTIEEVEGQLAEVDLENIKRKARQEVGRARSIEDLKIIQVNRGYEAGWVYKMAKIKGIYK